MVEKQIFTSTTEQSGQPTLVTKINQFEEIGLPISGLLLVLPKVSSISYALFPTKSTDSRS
jgi:hypothetical protein